LIYEYILIFVLGAVVGSFLNVCIHRLPKGQSIVTPGSHCPECENSIPFYDNVPIFSYLILKGKCRFCKTSISARYPFVEFLSGLVSIALLYKFDFSLDFLAFFIFLLSLIVITFIDLDEKIIPNEISVGGMFAGLVFSLFIPQLHDVPVGDRSLVLIHLHSLGLSLLGVLIGGGSIYLMGVLGDFLFKKESMGGGDVKLLAMVGAFMGWKMAILAFFIAPFFGAFYGIIEKIRTKDTAIAYGPFLVLGSLICLFWGDAIVAWIMRGYGLY